MSFTSVFKGIRSIYYETLKNKTNSQKCLTNQIISDKIVLSKSKEQRRFSYIGVSAAFVFLVYF